MYKVLLHSNDFGWISDARTFEYYADASEWGHAEVEASLSSYQRCVDANIVVDFFDEYRVVSAD